MKVLELAAAHPPTSTHAHTHTHPGTCIHTCEPVGELPASQPPGRYQPASQLHPPASQTPIRQPVRQPTSQPASQTANQPTSFTTCQLAIWQGFVWPSAPLESGWQIACLEMGDGGRFFTHGSNKLEALLKHPQLAVLYQGDFQTLVAGP